MLRKYLINLLDNIFVGNLTAGLKTLAKKLNKRIGSLLVFAGFDLFIALNTAKKRIIKGVIV